MNENLKTGSSRSAGMVPVILIWVIFLFYFAQFGLGEMLSSSPKLRDLHQWLGVTTFVLFIVLWIITKSVPFIKRTRVLLPVTAGLLLSQVLLGIKISMIKDGLVTVHFVIAIVVFCLLVVLLRDMRYGAKM